MKDIRLPSTITSLKTIVTKPKQKDRFYQCLLPPKPPHVCLTFEVCCLYNCQLLYPSISPVTVALGVPASLVMPTGLAFHGIPNKALVWQAETPADFWQHEVIRIFLLCFFRVLWWEEKKKSNGLYWLLLVSCEHFYSQWWFSLLILKHVKPDSSVDQFKLVWGGFAICLPDPALPPSFQYFEPHFLYNS